MTPEDSRAFPKDDVSQPLAFDFEVRTAVLTGGTGEGGGTHAMHGRSHGWINLLFGCYLRFRALYKSTVRLCWVLWRVCGVGVCEGGFESLTEGEGGRIHLLLALVI